MGRTALLVLAAASLCSLAATGAAAHGAVNAREVEVLVLQDEKSDLQTSLSGYDLGDFYVGEAWFPGYGDGIYFHTLLFGSFPGNPPGKEFKVVFTLVPESGSPIVRTLKTPDGTNFVHDFSFLEFKSAAAEVDIDRAFIKFEGTGLHVGSKIKSFIVESFVDGELRDRAPGGIYPPGGQGKGEVPQGASRQVVDSYIFTGPIKYASANFTQGAKPGDYVVTIQNRLAKGSQHVHLAEPEWAQDDAEVSGWAFQFQGASGGEVKPKETLTVKFHLTPVGGPDGLAPVQWLNVTTDVGGRIGFLLKTVGGKIAFVPEESKDFSASIVDARGGTAPGTSWMAGLVAISLGVTIFGRIGRRD